MSHDVMISFSSKNISVVEKIVEALENAGIKCWVSYRDIKQGASYMESITRAIRNAKVVVFVMCRHFNDSKETEREMALASQYRKDMMPLMIEDFELSDSLIYMLANVQYTNAASDFDGALRRMIGRLREVLNVAPVDQPTLENEKREIIEERKENQEADSKAKSTAVLNEWWTSFLRVENSGFFIDKKSITKPYMSASSGVLGIVFAYRVAKKKCDVGIYIDRAKGGRQENLRILHELESSKENIENILQASLLWERLDGKRACRISYVLDGGFEDDRSEWGRIQANQVDAMNRFIKAIKLHLEKID